MTIPPNSSLDEEKIDETSEQSFPASDPPSWGAPVRVGAPRDISGETGVRSAAGRSIATNRPVSRQA